MGMVRGKKTEGQGYEATAVKQRGYRVVVTADFQPCQLPTCLISKPVCEMTCSV